MKRVKFFVLLIITMSVMLMFTSCKKKVNIADYFDLTFDGYSGYTTVNSELLYEKFLEECIDKNKLTPPLTAILLEERVNIKYNKEKNISNNDVIIAELNLDLTDLSDMEKSLFSSINVDFTNGTIKKEVKNLKECKVMNPFDYVDVLFLGDSPEIYAEVLVKDFDEKTMDKNLYDQFNELYNLKCIIFSFSKEKNINKGAHIKVAACYNDSFMKSEGIIIENKNKDIVVE